MKQRSNNVFTSTVYDALYRLDDKDIPLFYLDILKFRGPQVGCLCIIVLCVSWQWSKRFVAGSILVVDRGGVLKILNFHRTQFLYKISHKTVAYMNVSVKDRYVIYLWLRINVKAYQLTLYLICQ